MKQHHIVPGKNGGWDIKTSNCRRASAHIETKSEAINVGIAMSRNQHSELFIHNKNGKISERDSHRNDPFPPRG